MSRIAIVTTVVAVVAFGLALYAYIDALSPEIINTKLDQLQQLSITVILFTLRPSNYLLFIGIILVLQQLNESQHELPSKSQPSEINQPLIPDRLRQRLNQTLPGQDMPFKYDLLRSALSQYMELNISALHPIQTHDAIGDQFAGSLIDESEDARCILGITIKMISPNAVTSQQSTRLDHPNRVLDDFCAHLFHQTPNLRWSLDVQRLEIKNSETLSSPYRNFSDSKYVPCNQAPLIDGLRQLVSDDIAKLHDDLTRAIMTYVNNDDPLSADQLLHSICKRPQMLCFFAQADNALSMTRGYTQP